MNGGLDNLLESKDWSRCSWIMGCCAFWGFLAHGFCFFNATAWYDSVASMFWGLGTSFGLGRFSLAVLESFFLTIFGSNGGHPFVNGMGSVFCIALILCMLADMLELKKKFSLFAVSGALVAFPVVTHIYSYMFTALAYFIGTTAAVAGVYVILGTEKPGIFRYILSAVLIVFGTGCYQSNLPVAVSAFVLVLLCRALKAETDEEAEQLFFTGLKCALICVLSLLLYLGINNACVRLMNVSMNDHAGMDHYGMTDPIGYLRRFFQCYNVFFRPPRSIYHSLISKIYKGLELWMVILCIIALGKTFRESAKRGALLLFLLLLYPFATCLITFLAEAPVPLTMYPYAFVFVFFVFLLEKGHQPESAKGILNYRLGALFVLFFALWFSRLSEETYFMNTVVQQRLQSYYSALYTRIISAPGYKETLPVCYIHPANKSSLNMTVTDSFETLGSNSIPLDDYAWKKFLQEWIGFQPEEVDDETWDHLECLPEVQAMPCYPDDGSIRVIEDTVVVKFGNED